MARFRRLALLAALAGVGVRPAAAQTIPLQTEPATTAARGTLVFETGLEAMRDDRNYVTGIRRTVWDGPLLRLLYSPADDVELGVEWVARVGTIGDDGRDGAQSSDFGDVTLRAKWRVVEAGASTLAVRFGVTLPETKFEDKQFRPLGLGPNTLRTFVEGLITRRAGRGVLHVEGGLFLIDEVFRPHDQRDFFSYGVAFEWPLRPGLSAIGEVAGRTGKPKPGAEVRAEARAGVRLGSGRLRWGVALRRGIATADGSWGATAGVSWTLRPRSR